jgi:ribosomal protein L37AE/L43A
MAFDDIPEDKELSYQCPICGSGSVTLQPNEIWWECDECDFARENKKETTQPKETHNTKEL